MILYLDTSALVKVYLKEEFSDIVREEFLLANTIGISSIGYVEFHSALSRLFRENQLNEIQLNKIKLSFEEHWRNFMIIDLEDSIIKKASELIYKTELRAFDSIHLASAEFIKNNIDDNLIFGCFDKRLMSSAELIGLALIKNIGK